METKKDGDTGTPELSLKQWLGITKDVVNVGSTGAGIGFNIAEKSTKFGFGIATGVLNGLSWAGDRAVGPNPVSMVLSGVSAIVSGSEQLTNASLQVSRTITTSSLDATSGALSSCGAEDGELLKTMGYKSEDVDAFVFVSKLISQFGDGIKLQTSIVYDIGLLSRLQWLAELGKSPSQIEVTEHERNEISIYVLHALSAYGKFVCAFLGISPNASQNSLNDNRNGDNEGSGQEELSFISKVCNVAIADIVKHKRESSPYDPSFFISLDRKRRAVVVTFRGTLSFGDALTDLVCDHEPYEIHGTKGFIHRGFKSVAKKLAQQLEPLIQEKFQQIDEEEDKFSLVLTGHSLGAGAATSLTVFWMKSGIFKERNLKCYAYASPCVFSHELATHPSLRQVIKSVVIKDDLVPRLCHGSAWDIRGRILQIQNLRESNTREYSNLMQMVNEEKGISKQNALALYRLLDPEEEPKRRLYPAGTIYYDDQTSSQVQCKITRLQDTEFLGDILLSGTMLTNHMPKAYSKLAHQQYSYFEQE